ncbi:Outer membrane protein ImpK/VasF [Photobacterium marinum]|uniref:Outer membrane protein ImpK/VasF n=1 Tax=Photobacterium marinum TaxID=1056511 RepID=L8JAZ8_9GAMM|nr:type VI secretion system protein TssL, long form [Photobacterium marinum]ELR64607.1 Outer membrane protein ImpK/VasF [Photobacterium marinum]
MTEATLLKPRPGIRGINSELKPQKEQPSEFDHTVVLNKIKTGERLAGLPSLGDNPLLEDAGVLLSIIAQIRSTPDHHDVPALKQSCIEKVREYEIRLRAKSVDGESIESARYCLCSFIDETVLNTAWGGQSSWGTESLLSTFHAETLGGEYFYTLLDNALSHPHTNWQLLELQYLCLSLGFIGKMRVEERGMDRLEFYREQIFQQLTARRGESQTELSPDTKARVLIGAKPKSDFPVWVIISVFSALTLGVYMGFSYHLNAYSNEVFNQINDVARWEAVKTDSTEEENPGAKYLQQLLQSEVEKGAIEFVELPDRIRIVINSNELFVSGSAEVKGSLIPLLSKIARALESTQGRILITGHTDDQPIFTSKYPSNWHLSLARATAVANTIALGTQLHGRLWPEGMGDSEPRNPNNSAKNRAKNRRVEIDLLYSK